MDTGFSKRSLGLESIRRRMWMPHGGSLELECGCLNAGGSLELEERNGYWVLKEELRAGINPQEKVRLQLSYSCLVKDASRREPRVRGEEGGSLELEERNRYWVLKEKFSAGINPQEKRGKTGSISPSIIVCSNQEL